MYFFPFSPHRMNLIKKCLRKMLSTAIKHLFSTPIYRSLQFDHCSLSFPTNDTEMCHSITFLHFFSRTLIWLHLAVTILFTFNQQLIHIIFYVVWSQKDYIPQLTMDFKTIHLMQQRKPQKLHSGNYQTICQLNSSDNVLPLYRTVRQNVKRVKLSSQQHGYQGVLDFVKRKRKRSQSRSQC